MAREQVAAGASTGNLPPYFARTELSNIEEALFNISQFASLLCMSKPTGDFVQDYDQIAWLLENLVGQAKDRLGEVRMALDGVVGVVRHP